MKVNDESERRLRAAMDRILADNPIRSNGSHTITALAIEAGVSRRTAGRASGVLRDFRDATAEAARGPAADGDEATRLRDALAEVRKGLAERSAEIRRLRSDIAALACKVALLSEENAQLRSGVDGGTVIALPSP